MVALRDAVQAHPACGGLKRDGAVHKVVANPLSYGFLSPARSRRANPFPGAARRGKEREPSARARGGQFIGGIRAHTFSFGRRAAQLSTSVGSEKKFCLNCSSIACVSSTLMAAALDPARRCAQGFPGNKRAPSFKASGE